MAQLRRNADILFLLVLRFTKMWMCPNPGGEQTFRWKWDGTWWTSKKIYYFFILPNEIPILVWMWLTTFPSALIWVSSIILMILGSHRPTITEGPAAMLGVNLSHTDWATTHTRKSWAWSGDGDGVQISLFTFPRRETMSQPTVATSWSFPASFVTLMGIFLLIFFLWKHIRE